VAKSADTGNGPKMGLCSCIKSYLSTNLRLHQLNYDTRQIELGKNGGNLGIILEKHTTMFFLDMMGETISKISNLSMDELRKDWEDVRKEFEKARTSLQTYRMWAMKL